MNVSLFQVLISLILGIIIIILLTVRYRVHAFYALLIACFLVGLGVQMPVETIIKQSKEGFGNIMQSLGLIIVLGTTLGVLLEHSGSTHVMANYILKKIGEKRAAFSMSCTGFIVGLPIFCDSGYIVLNGLNQSLAKRTRISPVIMSSSLATGLYSVHCLIPPHPGAAAAAGTIGVDLGALILNGIVVAIPALITAYWWIQFAGKKFPQLTSTEFEEKEDVSRLPSTTLAFLPVIVPILLIALRSFLTLDSGSANVWSSFINLAGDPVIALTIGIILAALAGKGWNRQTISRLLTEAAEKAGSILVIIGAGGAFGGVLAATNLGVHLGKLSGLETLGIFFPFLLTFVLKTALGSSTVAIITAASIIQPMLPALGFNSPHEKLLCVLSMGAGSMMISHANDAYFWVIAKFSGIEMKTMLRVYSVATIFMGIVSILVVYLLSLFTR